jgi:hypothetical protein
MVRDQAQETLKNLAHSKLLKRAAGHEVHLHIKRNGEITYKAPSKSNGVVPSRLLLLALPFL